MAAPCAMKLAQASTHPRLGRRASFATPGKAVRPLIPSRQARHVTYAKHVETTTASNGIKALAVGSALSSLMMAGNAQAFQEFATLSSDSRLGTISLLFVPVLGWVGFNILGPATRQLESMQSESAPASTPTKGTKRTKRAAVATAVGMSALASMLAVDSAHAASEFAQLADSDSRLGIIATLFVPVLAWVGFNILGPATRQLESMQSDKPAAAPKATRALRSKKAGLAAVLGLTAASMLMVDDAHAATELAQLADSDGRVGAILTLFVPVLGWVAFNIFGPALRQLDAMSSESSAPAPKKATTRVTKKKGMATAVGLSTAASLMAVESAHAASEFAQLADSDGRVGAILTLFVPVVGWVAFNIFGPALRQLDAMSAENSGAAPKKATTRVTKKKGIAAAMGLTTVASLMAVESANAASEFAQLADSDGRLGAILTLFVPVVGWVAFNIFGPALRQLDAMSAENSGTAPKKSTTKITKRK